MKKNFVKFIYISLVVVCPSFRYIVVFHMAT